MTVKKIKLLAFCLLLAITLINITPARAATAEPISAEKRVQINAAIEKASADGKITYEELKTIATEAKGRKLTLRDKIALRLFGKRLSKMVAQYGDGSKSKTTAIFLCLFLGDFGVHRFYLGYTWQGIVQAVTLGGLGIWATIDFFRIIFGNLQPKDGEYN